MGIWLNQEVQMSSMTCEDTICGLLDTRIIADASVGEQVCDSLEQRHCPNSPGLHGP